MVATTTTIPKVSLLPETPMAKIKLSPNLETDQNNYFFTLLSDRFSPLNQIWKSGLEKRFGKPFKPIYVLPFPNADKSQENYVVLNKELDELNKTIGKSNPIYLPYPEDLNKQFSESVEIKKIIDRLALKQEKIFILSFTSVWLDLSHPKVAILGPDSKVAEFYDDKVEHIRTFKKLGFPVNNTAIYKTFGELRKKHKKYPIFLSASYSSGGIESRSIYTLKDLENYYASLRSINKKQPFIAAELIDDIVLAPNVTCLIDGGNTTVLCIADQLLRNNQYMGNIYPSQVSAGHRKLIVEMSLKMGGHLHSKGFKGLFGMDFLITKTGAVYPVDLNPRRQGGYYCVVMSSKLDIVELELKIILGDETPKIPSKIPMVSYCWAHSKLTPYFPNMKITKSVRTGDPAQPFHDIGSTYATIFYPVDHVVLTGNPGLYLTTDKSYKRIKQRLYEEVEKTISKSYEIYEG